MRLQSVRDLKQEILSRIIDPVATAAAPMATAAVRTVATRSIRGVPAAERKDLVATTEIAGAARPRASVQAQQRSVALGISSNDKGDFRLAVRVQRQALMRSRLVETIVEQARGEADVRMIGRVEKRNARAARSAVPWYQQNSRPLRIGASVAHVDVTAGTLGAFVRRGSGIFILSNNHVLANEDRCASGDAVVQRSPMDGGRDPRDRVAVLRHYVRLNRRRTNLVDAALARLDEGVDYEVGLLQGLVRGDDRMLKGVADEPLKTRRIVYKVGRTTGATKGRITAFELDNIVVDYDTGNIEFDSLIEIEGADRDPFSDGGDSGSLIVDARMNAIGLLFCGTETGGRNGLGLTYANPIDLVLDAVNAELLF